MNVKACGGKVLGPSPFYSCRAEDNGPLVASGDWKHMPVIR
jgi:hypothetical protein